MACCWCDARESIFDLEASLINCIAIATQKHNGEIMKNATLPSLRVDDELRSAAESVLRDGETISSFVLDAVRLNIARREAQREFIARGLAARDDAERTGQYVSAADMLKRLDQTIANARAKQKISVRAR